MVSFVQKIFNPLWAIGV